MTPLNNRRALQTDVFILNYYFLFMSTHSYFFALMSTHSRFLALMSAKKRLCVLMSAKKIAICTHKKEKIILNENIRLESPSIVLFHKAIFRWCALKERDLV